MAVVLNFEVNFEEQKIEQKILSFCEPNQEITVWRKLFWEITSITVNFIISYSFQGADFKNNQTTKQTKLFRPIGS